MTNGLMFALGAAVGAVASYFIFRNRFKEKAEAEIADMREYVRERMKEVDDESADTDDQNVKVSFNEVEETEVLKDTIQHNHYNYNEVATDDQNEKKGEAHEMESPFMITPEEFDLNVPDNAQITVIWYVLDDILATDDDEVIDLECIGNECLKHFGETHVPDTVYVRNDNLGIDYEVINEDREHYDGTDAS